MHVFDDVCGECGEELDHPRWSPLPKRQTVVRLFKIGLAATLLLGVPTAYFLMRYAKRAEVDPWRVGAELDTAANAGDWQTARVRARQLVDLSPSNAAGWFMLAFSGRKLGMNRQLLVSEAREAVRHQPDHGPAHYLLAVELAELGESEEARVHAAAAMKWPSVPDGIWRLAGELELNRVRPDLDRALELLETGYARGVRDPVLVVRAAQVRMQLVGIVAPERYPAELTISLQRARDALEELVGVGDDGLAPWFAGEVAFAEGRMDDAAVIVDEALDQPRESADTLVVARLYLLAARVALARGKPDAAVEAIRSALARSSAAEIVERASGVLAIEGMSAEARDVLREAAPNDERGIVWAALADLDRREGRLAEALEHADRAQAASGNAPWLRVLVGDIHRDAGRVEQAREEYRAALEPGGDAVPAEIRIAMLDLEAPGATTSDETAEQAIQRLEAALDRHPDSVQLQLALASALLPAGRADEAVRHLERVLARRPWSPEVWVLLSEAYRVSTMSASAIRAAEAARQAVRIRPFDRDVVLAAARAAARAGDDLATIACTSVYLTRTPDDVSILRLRADARMRRREWVAAVADLERAIEVGDESAIARMQLADAYARTGEVRRAFDLMNSASDPSVKRAIEIVLASHEELKGDLPTEFESASARAIVHVRAGRIERAVAELRSAVDANPRDAAASRSLVFLLTAAEIPGLDRAAQLHEAQSVADQLGRAGGEGIAELLRGRLLAAGGDHEAAVRPLQRAADRLPWDAGAQFELAEALRETGDLVGAARRYRAAVWVPRGRDAYGEAIAVRLFEIAQADENPASRERLLADALRANPSLVPAAELLARTLLGRGEARAAADVAEVTLASLEIGDESTLGLRRTALAARVETGDADAAARHLDALEAAGHAIDRPELARGIVLLQGDQAEEAVPQFRAALERDPDDLLAALGLTESLVRCGEVDAVHEFLTARLAERPSEVALSRVATRSLVRHGYGASALREARAAVGREPHGPEAVRQLVWVLGGVGQSQSALEVVDAAADGAPDDERGLLEALAAEVLTQLRDEPEAGLERARRVIDDPRVTSAARLSARIVQAESLAELSRFAEATVVCDELRRGWKDGRPQTADDVRIEPRVCFVMGMIALGDERMDEAAELFVRASRLDRTLHAAANNAAWCIATTTPGSTLAMALAQQATATAPKIGTYWDTLAVCQRGAGQWKDAVVSWERAEALLSEEEGAEVERARIAADRAQVLLDLGRVGDAVAAARLSLRLDPRGPSSGKAQKIAAR